jgi:hypothetical protein
MHSPTATLASQDDFSLSPMRDMREPRDVSEEILSAAESGCMAVRRGRTTGRMIIDLKLEFSMIL